MTTGREIINRQTGEEGLPALHILTKGEKISLTRRRHIDWSDLHNLYALQHLTLQAIANLKGCNSEAVRHHTHKLRIPMRTRWQHLIGKTRERNPNWKGGRCEKDGYILIRQPGHPYGHNGYVFEHRLVMEKRLGRFLLPSETVHHRPDVAKDDNREEVLYLMPNPSDHSRLSPCSNCALKKEIRLLRWQVKELNEALQLKLGGGF